MLFLSDVKDLFALADDRYAVMCVKHSHVIEKEGLKMDKRPQLRYMRKNWSSFVLWNCGHEANRYLTKEAVGFMKGSDLHAFSWLDNKLIGDLPFSYNYIAGISPKLPPERGARPDVIHYTEGGPWFDECKDVPYAQTWVDEYENWQAHGKHISEVPSVMFSAAEVMRK